MNAKKQDETKKHHWQEKLSNLLKPKIRNQVELIEQLRSACQARIIPNYSLRMIERVINVSSEHVRDVMIPRSKMTVVNHDDVIKNVIPTIIDAGHSRFPVVGEKKEEIIGILLAKDLLGFTSQQQEQVKVEAVIRPAVFIPESKSLNVLLDEFRLKHNHLAIVVDEYGSVSGMITIEDVLEEIVGDIEDEYDITDTELAIRKLNDYQFTINGLLPIEDFNSRFKMQLSDEEFDTIGGYVTHHFGHVPKRGEVVLIEDTQFKVLHADNRRIRLLRVTLPKKEQLPDAT